MKTRRTKRRRRNCGIKDRLSDLPDCILLRILSFFDSKKAVQSCILSTRWKNLWKTLPILTLDSSYYTDVHGFRKFVSKILSLRDCSIALNSLNLICGTYFMDPRLFKTILEYASSHNVERLKIRGQCHIEQFPPSFFSCHTLTSLNLSVWAYPPTSVFPNSLNLPLLTKLSIQCFIFCVDDDGRIDPFSKLNKLNSLIIKTCEVRGKQNLLCISSATLVNLTIMVTFNSKSSWLKFSLSTPNLCTFVFSGIPCQKLCGSMNNLSSIKHVTIYIPSVSNYDNTPLVLLNWLVELANIESLTVSQNTLKVLSLDPDLLKVEFPSLHNLKSLKITKTSSSSIPNETVDFLLQNAPSAKLTSYVD